MDRVRSFVVAHSTEITVFLAAFAIRVAYAFLVQVVSGAHGFISHADAEFFYYRSAINLVDHHVFSVAASAPYFSDAYHTPLYSLFLALFLWLKVSLLGIVLIQSLVAAGTVVLVYKSTHFLTTSRKTALVCAAISAVEPMSLYWGGLLMSDTLFAFLFSCALYLLMKKRMIASVSFLGLAALTRPIALYFAPAFLLMIAYLWFSVGESRKVIFQKLLLCVVLFAVILVPWFVRNKIVFNHFAFTSAGWYELYVAPLPEFAERYHIEVPEVATELPPEQSFMKFDFKYSGEYKDAFMQVISHNPIRYFVVHVERSFYSFFSNRYDYLFHVVLQSQAPTLYARTAVVVPLVLFLGSLFWIAMTILGLCAIGNERTRPWWLFFWALLGVNALLSGGINPGGADMSRYVLGFYVFVFALAEVGWQEIVKWRIGGRE